MTFLLRDVLVIYSQTHCLEHSLCYWLKFIKKYKFKKENY